MLGHEHHSEASLESGSRKRQQRSSIESSSEWSHLVSFFSSAATDNEQGLLKDSNSSRNQRVFDKSTEFEMPPPQLPEARVTVRTSHGEESHRATRPTDSPSRELKVPKEADLKRYLAILEAHEGFLENLLRGKEKQELDHIILTQFRTIGEMIPDLHPIPNFVPANIAARATTLTNKLRSFYAAGKYASQERARRMEAAPPTPSTSSAANQSNDAQAAQDNHEQAEQVHDQEDATATHRKDLLSRYQFLAGYVEICKKQMEQRQNALSRSKENLQRFVESTKRQYGLPEDFFTQVPPDPARSHHSVRPTFHHDRIRNNWNPEATKQRLNYRSNDERRDGRSKYPRHN